MRYNSHLDVSGNIKLHGRVIDKTVVQGGFYSGQFGEMAYKSDLDGTIQNFYGLVVKETYTPGNNTYSGINVLNFDTNFFYLTQNSPNTDEVVVNLKATRRKVFYRSGMKHVRNEPTPSTANVSHSIIKFDIPPNTLPNKIVKVTFQGYAHVSNSSDDQSIVIALNGIPLLSQDVVMVESTGPRTSRLVAWLAMTESTPPYVMLHAMFGNSNAQGSGSLGVGLWNTGTNAIDGYAGGFHVPDIDPTITQTFELYWEPGSLASSNQFYVMSVFAEEI